MKNSTDKVRVKYMTQNKRCCNCLSDKHKTSDCPSPRRCAFIMQSGECKAKHHTLLHLDPQPLPRVKSAFTDVKSSKTFRPYNLRNNNQQKK